uniref:hypothetical protein n=1 Tax=Photorhabdus sp. RM322S TaxID=3342825 RepID=UPI0036DD6370
MGEQHAMRAKYHCGISLTQIQKFDFTVLKINGFSLEIVQADPDLKDAIEYFQQLGARLYRGPMVILKTVWECVK